MSRVLSRSSDRDKRLALSDRPVLQREQPGDGAVFFIPNTYPDRYYTHRAEIQHRVKEAPEILYPPTPGQPLSREEVMNVTNGHKRVWPTRILRSNIHGRRPSWSPLWGSCFSCERSAYSPERDLITIELYSRAQTEH